jgi:hypothetical protein
LVEDAIKLARNQAPPPKADNVGDVKTMFDGLAKKAQKNTHGV